MIKYLLSIINEILNLTSFITFNKYKCTDGYENKIIRLSLEISLLISALQISSGNGT